MRVCPTRTRNKCYYKLNGIRTIRNSIAIFLSLLFYILLSGVSCLVIVSPLCAITESGMNLIIYALATLDT